MTYWSERTQRERERANKKTEAEFKKELEDLYRMELGQLRKELDAYIQNFAEKNGLAVEEAKKRASEFDIKGFESKARRYVAEKDFSATANEELRNYNFSMSVGRRELLIQQLELELMSLAEGEEKLMREYLNTAYKAEMARGSLLDQSVLKGNILAHAMETAVNANFEGAKWSERIWGRNAQLRQLVRTEVTRALIRGDNGLTIARRIRKHMDVSRANAERLAITEHARVQTLAQQDIMKENGFEFFKLMPESRACDYCKQVGRDTEREPVPIDKMESGLNAPPMHPYCRCAVAEVYVESGMSRLYRNKDSNKRRPINIVRQNHLTKDFRKRGGVVWQDDEAERYLKSQKAAAMNLNAETIVLQKKATISEVLEELYHAEQWKDGRLVDEPVSKIKAEIEAQNYLLSVSKRYNIPRSEIEQTKNNLKYWKEELKKHEN